MLLDPRDVHHGGDDGAAQIIVKLTSECVLVPFDISVKKCHQCVQLFDSLIGSALIHFGLRLQIMSGWLFITHGWATRDNCENYELSFHATTRG